MASYLQNTAGELIDFNVVFRGVGCPHVQLRGEMKATNLKRKSKLKDQLGTGSSFTTKKQKCQAKQQREEVKVYEAKAKLNKAKTF